MHVKWIFEENCAVALRRFFWLDDANYGIV